MFSIILENNSCFIFSDDRIASTISVIRLHSPTSSNSKDDNKKSKKGNNINNNGSTSNVESDEKLSATNENSTENNTENDSRKVLGVTIEAFYHPDEAKQIAKEILSNIRNTTKFVIIIYFLWFTSVFFVVFFSYV